MDPLTARPRSREIWQAEQPLLSSGLTALTLQLPIAFESARNDVLYDVDGAEYIDWSGGTLTSSTGHCNPRVADAIKQQLDRLWNIHDHPSHARVRVMQRLLERMPGPDYVFQFYTTGAETIEAALRATLSAVSLRRRRIASFAEGYHGKTRGSLMAVHAIYGRNSQPEHLAPLSLPFPNCYRCPYDQRPDSCALQCASAHVAALEADRSVGAFVLEPVLGTGGGHGLPEGYWDQVGSACQRLGILVIADEVTTGAFRTGSFLACEQFGVVPDLVAFAKGIASGFPAMVLAGRRALLRDDAVFDDAAERAPTRRLNDFRALGSSSSTFGGNPLAITAIDATLDEFERLAIAAHVTTVGGILERGLSELAAHCPTIGDVRHHGMMLAVELVRDRTTKVADPELAVALYRECAARGLLIKIDGQAVVHITPPLTLTAEHAVNALEIFASCLERMQSVEGPYVHH